MMGGMTRLLLLLWAGVTLTTALDLQKRIHGGEPCERKYHVKVKAVSPDGKLRGDCGGSLIHKQWILTAAHCYESGWTMEAALQVDSGKDKWKDVKIKRHVIKEEGGKQHDIMLLELDVPVKVNPVNLPDCVKEPKPNIGDEVRVAGHGDLTKPGGQRPTTLQCVDLMVDDCKAYMNILEKIANWIFQFWKYQHQFCGHSPGKDTCPGDSGGGVVFNNMIYGVHHGSGRTDCSASAVFMDVCEYRDWIMDTIKG